MHAPHQRHKSLGNGVSRDSYSVAVHPESAPLAIDAPPCPAPLKPVPPHFPSASASTSVSASASVSASPPHTNLHPHHRACARTLTPSALLCPRWGGDYSWGAFGNLFTPGDDDYFHFKEYSFRVEVWPSSPPPTPPVPPPSPPSPPSPPVLPRFAYKFDTIDADWLTGPTSAIDGSPTGVSPFGFARSEIVCDCTSLFHPCSLCAPHRSPHSTTPLYHTTPHNNPHTAPHTTPHTAPPLLHTTALHVAPHRCPSLSPHRLIPSLVHHSLSKASDSRLHLTPSLLNSLPIQSPHMPHNSDGAVKVQVTRQ